MKYIIFYYSNNFNCIRITCACDLSVIKFVLMIYTNRRYNYHIFYTKVKHILTFEAHMLKVTQKISCQPSL